MLGVCYYYAVSELVCLSQRVSDLARFMEECKSFLFDLLELVHFGWVRR